MQSLHSLPVLYNLIEKQRYDEALSIIDDSVEVFAPHLLAAFPDDFVGETTSSLTLARLNLAQKNYTKCVEYAVRARELLHTLDRFYYDSIIFHMMDYLLSFRTGENPSAARPHFYEDLRVFVLSFIKDDAQDVSLMGFLAEMGEFGMVKDMLRGLAKTDVDCTELLNVLFGEYYAELSDMMLGAGTVNRSMLHHVINTYVEKDKQNELTAMLNRLPWDALYAACFYIEDTHHLKLELENENANFILSGDWKQEIMSNFMLKNCKTSFRFLESMVKARAPYISLCNCLMNAGTTNDTLYRNNKGMIGGKEWVRFIEYAAIGMVHHGNINGFEILKEVLPSFESNSGEAGALMALGLMNACSSDHETTDYLLNWLENGTDELVFGACMGLGMNLMQSGDRAVAEKLKALFSVDSTIIQESACYALGMVYAGTSSPEMLAFLKTVQTKTDFPRVKRACGIAIALAAIMKEGEPISILASVEKNSGSVYEIKEGAAESGCDSGYDTDEDQSSCSGDPKYGIDGRLKAAIESLLRDSCPQSRETAILSLGTAYVASSNLAVIQAILPYINDGDDDVKRTAVIAIAMIGFFDTYIIESCILPLAQNHNMHVRAAVALALGFFSCGTGDEEVAILLEALLYDTDVLVRQSASIGVGFALVQTNPSIIPNYKRIIDRLHTSIVSKAESSCVKIGAAIGRSIVELGGRSAIFSLTNFSRNLEVKRIAGALLFLQSWYWYPLVCSISLCMLPTPVLFFDENLDETDDVIANDSKYYDYLVRIPETRKSRKFKASKDGDHKDVCTPAPEGLRSGSRIFEKERMALDLGCPVIFKKKKDEQ
ncbi:26S proteasome regulatory subunit N2 [Pancytospora philotis]|nr:26S proteasome regulatory subunit N2 [Pancytospora philotis]KAI4291092.1 26S proteasome regulatory subunit N2 [Pancytospora philotis]